MVTVEDLDVYKRSHKFTLGVYRVTTGFPLEEKYGLTSQIRRSSASINANLMEGAARISNNEYKHFVSIAKGSASELIYHMILAKDLGFINTTAADILIDEIRQIARMLNGLYKSIC